MTDSDVAMEHIFWCQYQGMSPADVLVSIGCVLPSFRPAEWTDAVLALGITWRRMQEKMAEEWRAAA